ncbi:hypothetical protein EMCG_04612 [[Emmonsia] crescens]|uniref:Uncharacterized protein n=1 Tax=[Emmonsia] crescens TaxID=73230 RepID=A0A0G2HSM6_9EURO|nr:hypothetical protein EMCG_04612 [Emmonsia crescens UAMH 3008]
MCISHSPSCSRQSLAPLAALHTPGHWYLLWQPPSRMYCNSLRDELDSSVDQAVKSNAVRIGRVAVVDVSTRRTFHKEEA